VSQETKWLAPFKRLVTSQMSAIKSVSLLWIGSILGAAAAFLTQVILARQLGPADFGAFAAAIGTVTLLVPIASFGVGSFWLRIFGLEGWHGLRWLRSSLTYTIFTTAGVLTLLFIWVAVGPHDYNSRCILSILSIYLLGQVLAQLQASKLQLEERYFTLALWQFLPHLARMLFILILSVIYARELYSSGVAIVYAAVSLVFFGVAARSIYRMHDRKFDLKGHGARPSATVSYSGIPTMWQVASQSWPFGLAGSLYLIYFQSDIILLKYIKGDEVAGVYNVAFVLMTVIYLLPSVVYQKFLMPKLHRWAENDSEKFRQVHLYGTQLMFVLGVTATLAIWGFIPSVVPYLFGAQYSDSILPISILAVAAPARFVASGAGAVLTTRNHMKNKILIMGFAALSNLLMNIILIPKFGILGAVGSTVATEVMLAFAMQIYVKKYVFPA